MNKEKKAVRLIAVLLASLFICTMLCASAPKSDTYKTSALKVSQVSYNPFKRTVEFKFNKTIKTKNLKVTIKRTKTSSNEVKSIRSKGSQKIVVNVNRLKYGFKYTYKISGIKKKGAKKYITLSGTFRAVHRW